MTLSRYIFFAWFGFLTIISCFLIFEYNNFMQAANDLNKLKEEYNQTVALLQKQLDPESIKKEENTQKSSISDKKSEFLVVNRKPAYLQKSALSFARRHKLERDLKKMYLSNVRAKIVKNSNTGKRGIKFYRKESQVNNEIVKRDRIFTWPIKRSECYLSSRFGPRKKPNGQWDFHRGIDLAACRGTLIKTCGSGRVIEAQFASGYGNTVVIEHDAVYKTRYAHLDKILVKLGQQVMQGDKIGKVGSTGCVRTKRKGGDPSHLHLEVYRNGKQDNPIYYLK